MEKTDLVFLDYEILAKLGVIVAINSRILHPLGLALSWNLETKQSEGCIVSEDGLWTYPEDSAGVVEKNRTFQEFCERLTRLKEKRIKEHDTSDIRPSVLEIINEILNCNSN